MPKLDVDIDDDGRMLLLFVWKFYFLGKDGRMLMLFVSKCSRYFVM